MANKCKCPTQKAYHFRQGQSDRPGKEIIVFTRFLSSVAVSAVRILEIALQRIVYFKANAWRVFVTTRFKLR